MSFKNYLDYKIAEEELIDRVLGLSDFKTSSTNERFCEGFVLLDPTKNRNERSNYEYAEEFFRWMMSGEKQISQKLIELNPWVKRFVSETGLPESFSASYGWKIKNQFDDILDELKRNNETRRAYMNILYPDDHVILPAKTTHEYPCTIGFHFFIRDEALHMIVNMRSNNVYSVMPYDVYNCTRLQQRLAGMLNINLGVYFHQINNAHIYKGDVRRLMDMKLRLV